MTELLPCPFCGGEARVNTLPWVGGYTATALCKNEPNAHYLNTWDEDEAKAVERITDAWNTRAERTCKNNAPSYLDFLCSECGFVHYHSEANDTGDGNEWNYCPNCGARVRSE